MSTFLKHWGEDAGLYPASLPTVGTIKPDTTPEHSRLSPSKAYQWTTCTASIPFIEKNQDRLPPDTSSAAANEGTNGHTVGETMLLNHFKELDQPLPEFIKKDKDMKNFCQQYADYCIEVAGARPDIKAWGVERRVPLFYLKSERGTVDFWCLNKSGLHLVDFKYGYDPVDSNENKQIAIYAKSLIDEITANAWMTGNRIGGDTPVTITVFQPRVNLPLTTWKTTVAELEKFVYVEIELHAKDILAGKKGVFKPGTKTCKYCRAASICEARGAWLLADMEEVAGVPDKKLPPVKGITDARILEIYHHTDDIKAWLKDIEDYVEKKVLAGMEMDGLKVVLSDGAHRRWTDEKAAAKLLMDNGVPYDEVYDTSIISPAQAEKLVKTKKGKWMQTLYAMWFKPRGAPIVVKESDPRREHKPDFTSEFQDVPEPGETKTSLW